MAQWLISPEERFGLEVPGPWTERYHHPSYDDGAGTRAVADLIGVEGGSPPPDAPDGGLAALVPSPDDAGLLRPTRPMVAALAARYSNIALGKILGVSEAAVRKQLQRDGISRPGRIWSDLTDWEAAILRAELRAELLRGTDPGTRPP